MVANVELGLSRGLLLPGVQSIFFQTKLRILGHLLLVSHMCRNVWQRDRDDANRQLHGWQELLPNYDL